MKVAIQSPLLKLALGILVLPFTGCSSTTDTASNTNTSSAMGTQPTALSPPSNLAKPLTLKAPSTNDAVAHIKARYAAWKQSWTDMKIDAFMSFYSPKARSGKIGYAGIRERKQQQWAEESFIQITDIGQTTIKVIGNSAMLSTLQEYDSTTWWDKGIKSLKWQKSGGQWLIVNESFKVQSQRSKTTTVVAAPPPINQIVESQPVPNNAINTADSSKPTRTLNFNRDQDCSDFTTHAEAQAFFIAQGGPIRDPHWLDIDKDGSACEDLP